MEIEKDSETTKLAIEKLLKSEGIEEYDISSINCLNEFINSYLTDLIKSVKIKMNLTKKEKIDILLVASALKQKQNNMYQSKSSIYEMTYMANKINSFELPPIPETPVVLKPPILNNLLRNNFQIYSEDLNKILTEKKNKIKNEEINMLGNKRNTKDIIDNNKFVKKETKNKRKKSISQENKTSNKKNVPNPKINDSALSSNSLNNNNEGDYLSDLSDDSNEDNKESIINKKEDDFDMKDIGSNNSNDESDNSNDNNDSDDN